ncbi:TIGR04028 family ABC transporter substrate-binding protein [Corynebacterium casei]|uniref:TIGR04028 family ABC transporter substrate-binding protein n=1 Tax=Corynebacterium casei TaxID=160386 RepID=UPI0023F19FE9|nr:TIGR04028 family ABC transporter substrate-binding protein [Corynebacterium casei]
MATSLVVACTSSAESEESLGDEGGLEANEITYLEPQFFRTLYPPAAGFYPNGAVVNQITDRLLYQDPETLELSPWIATDLPEINEDATEFTFDIRTDVTYSDGTPLTAENVVRNIDLYGQGDDERLLNVSEQISNYDRGEVVDEDTVKFYFSVPSPGFEQAVSSFNAGLLADSTLDLDNEGFAPGNAEAVIGSGPFVIDGERLGTDLHLSAREDYDWAPPAHEHQGRARLDGINYVLAAEESMRTGAITSDQVQIVRQVSAPQEPHLEAAGLNVISRGTNGMNNQLAFRFNHWPFNEKAVREAVIHGVDREQIIHVLFSESYPLATSTMAATALGYKDQSAAYTFDPELSKRLLDDAGWEVGSDGIRVKDGKQLSVTAKLAMPQPRSREVITMVQEQLSEIGVEVRLNSGDQATQDADSKDPNKIQLDHTMVGRADYDVIKSLYSVNNRDSFINQDEDGNVLDQHLEDLLSKVVSTAGDERRAAATAEVQHYVTEQAYALPLFEEPVVYAVQPYLKGFNPEAIGRPSFYGAWIDHEEAQ